jgi:hypothetical protein
MKQEVAELSGNFCRELSVLETGEGSLGVFACVKKYETPGKVYRECPRTSIAKRYEK